MSICRTSLLVFAVWIAVAGVASAELTPDRGRRTDKARQFMNGITQLQNAIDRYIADHQGMSPFAADMSWQALLSEGYFSAVPINTAVPPGQPPWWSVDIGTSPMNSIAWVWDQATQTISATYFDERRVEFTPYTP